MALSSKVTWKDGMAFEAAIGEHTFTIDAGADVGGRGLGPAPKALTLTSLVGCTGMDVIAIVRKMKLVDRITSFVVEADGELSDNHPKRYTDITVYYRFEGDPSLPHDRLLRAVELSEDRYCGVSATLKPQVELHSVVTLNGEPISPGA